MLAPYHHRALPVNQFCTEYPFDLDNQISFYVAGV